MNDKVILIADDSLFMRKMLRNTLGDRADYLEAADGEEAVRLYAEHHPDLCFMDITMPRKSGLDALKEIMALDPEAKVVMCSAIGQDATIMEAISSGASEFIVKPFKPDIVIDVVNDLLLG